MRKYRTATAWAKDVPGMRMYLLLNAQGKPVFWHCSEPAPVGKWSLIGVFE